MKHHKKQRAFGRVSKQRDALLRSLARSLILHEAIKTTEAKAKELRPFVEKLITKAKKGDIAARRAIAAEFNSEALVLKKLFDSIAPRYKERAGGYTRVLKIDTKKEDSRKEARIDLV